ncbi:30S ribosomal protein S3, partial [Micromonospora provocatoris]
SSGTTAGGTEAGRAAATTIAQQAETPAGDPVDAGAVAAAATQPAEQQQEG